MSNKRQARERRARSNLSLVRASAAPQSNEETRLTTQGKLTMNTENQNPTDLTTPPKPFIAEIGDYVNKPKSDPIGNVGIARRREMGIDVSQQGSKMPPTLPTFGHFAQRPMTAMELEHAWPVLFNEQTNGAKLIDDLRALQHAPQALNLYLFAIKKRTVAAPGDDRERYLVVARLVAEDGLADAKPVAQYVVTVEPYDSMMVSASPVRATAVYRCDADEDISVKYKLYEEVQEPAAQAAGPTEEASEGTVAESGELLGRWIEWSRFLALFEAYVPVRNAETHQVNNLIGSAAGNVVTAGHGSSVVQMVASETNPENYLVRLAPNGGRNHPVLEFTFQAAVNGGRRQILSLQVVQQAPGLIAGSRHKQVVVPRSWMPISELAHRWPTIFNEDELGSMVIQRLGDLEKRTDSQIVLRFVDSELREGDKSAAILQAFKADELPSFTNVRAPFQTKQGEVVDPVDVITIHTTIVEGVEQAVKLEVQDDFVAGKPNADADALGRKYGHTFAARGTAPSQLSPSDMRTFDPVVFQQFVDGVLKAGISQQDSDRLVAFMEFIAKCQQIEKTLFFHCTALGRQLDMMLGAGRRHFPGAMMGTPASVFAPGGRWADAGKWDQRGQQQQALPSGSFVQPNQLANDVVISVYNATGTLLGVYQAAVAHGYPA